MSENDDVVGAILLLSNAGSTDRLERGAWRR